jgi:hypothetical protein
LPQRDGRWTSGELQQKTKRLGTKISIEFFGPNSTEWYDFWCVPTGFGFWTQWAWSVRLRLANLKLATDLSWLWWNFACAGWEKAIDGKTQNMQHFGWGFGSWKGMNGDCHFKPGRSFGMHPNRANSLAIHSKPTTLVSRRWVNCAQMQSWFRAHFLKTFAIQPSVSLEKLLLREFGHDVNEILIQGSPEAEFHEWGTKIQKNCGGLQKRKGNLGSWRRLQTRNLIKAFLDMKCAFRVPHRCTHASQEGSTDAFWKAAEVSKSLGFEAVIAPAHQSWCL